jgi:hypothetical protein
MARKTQRESDFLAATYREVARSTEETNAFYRRKAEENHRLLIQDKLNRGINPLSKEEKTR